ncbi:MAG TPA: SlyX family protein [Thiotrichaceae bacterium]|nr:SlyX family protein [Thiotrichaceae bacterium]
MPIARIEELEILIMQQDDSIESLSSTLHRQQLEIARLSKLVEAMSEQFKAMQQQSSGLKAEQDEVPPPHY